MASSWPAKANTPKTQRRGWPSNVGDENPDVVVSSPFSPSLAIRSAQKAPGSHQSGLDPYSTRHTGSRKIRAPRRASPGLSSSPSSRASESFFTAVGSPAYAGDTTGTAISTPTETKLEAEPEPAPVSASRYRSACPFPSRLEMKTDIPLEDGLDHSVQFLMTILNATPPQRAAYTPPPRHLALLGTFAVHPKYTTHTKEAKHARLSAQAVQCLRNILHTVGPVNAKLDEAFVFTSQKQDSDGNQDNEWGEVLQTQLARGSSVWQRAPDFWTALGWAFRCATSYPRRWHYWKVWVGLMIEVLEADWAERARLDEETNKSSPGGASRPPLAGLQLPTLRGSILSTWMSGQSVKELLRALMAFSSGDNPAHRGYFSAIFAKELATVQNPDQHDMLGKKVDLEKDDFGDYTMDKDLSSEGETEPNPFKSRKRRRAQAVKEDTDVQAAAANTAPGDDNEEDRFLETVPFRLRLFELLSQAYCQNENYKLSHEFYLEFALQLRQLPLVHFKQFLARHGTPLSHDVYTSLVRYVIQQLIPKDLADGNEREISIAMLETSFVPFSSGTASIEENAKLSFVLECMLHHIIARDSGAYAPASFRVAVEKGIEARREKTRPRRRGGRPAKDSPAEQAARESMASSEENLRMLVYLLEDADA